MARPMVFRAGAVALCLPILLTQVLSLPRDNPNHNLLTNGDFEHPGLDGKASVLGALKDMSHPSMPLGWIVSEGAIDYVRSDFWRAASGRHSVALNGGGAASISQIFKVQPGATYLVYFNLAGDPGLEIGAFRTLHVAVRADEELLAEKELVVDTYRHLKLDSVLGWEEHLIAFTATEPRATLTFTSTTVGPHGPVIDNVRVYKRGALSGFFFSPNTAYQGPILQQLTGSTSAEDCALRCLETEGCSGFSLGVPKDTLPGPCILRAEMRGPSRVPEYNTNSYIIKGAPCSFDHATQKPCPQVIPGQGLPPLACVSARGWKRTKQHGFSGVCKPLDASEMCHVFGGYFLAGTPAIGSGDNLRHCACTRSHVGMATMQCTRAI